VILKELQCFSIAFFIDYTCSFASEAMEYFSMYIKASYSKDTKNESKLHGLQLHKETSDGDYVDELVHCGQEEIPSQLFCIQSPGMATSLNLHDTSCVQKDLTYV
jgi:hypothetical protein